MSKRYAEIDLEWKAETEEAVLLNDGYKDFWIPKSVMEDWPDEGKTDTVLVQEWFAEKEGLI